MAVNSQRIRLIAMGVRLMVGRLTGLLNSVPYANAVEVKLSVHARYVMNIFVINSKVSLMEYLR